MARVFLTKVATRKLQKYHRHCCSNAKKEGKFLYKKNYKIAGKFKMLSLTNTFVSLNLQLILIGVIGAFLLRNVTDMAYGSVSAGREFWPFRVIFFQKVKPFCD